MILRYAVIVHGVVVNIIDAPEGFELPGATLIADMGEAAIGATWDGAGFTLPPPQPPPPSIPMRITRRQGRLALLHAGLLDQLEAMMASEETPRAIRITYEDALEWWRDDPMILALAPVLSLSPEQVDALFVAAAAL